MSGQKLNDMKCKQCGYAHPVGSACPPNSELAAPPCSAVSINDALWQADHAEDGEMTHEAAKVLAARVRHLNDVVDDVIRLCMREQ